MTYDTDPAELVSYTVSVTVCVILDVTVEKQMLSDETGRLLPVELGGNGVTTASVLLGAEAVYVAELTLLSPQE